MSLPEAASDRLRQCLSEIVPSSLAALSDLRQTQPHQLLLPFSQSHDALKPLINTEGVKEAFGIIANLPAADKDSAEVRIRNLCVEISNNELRKVLLEHPSGSSAGHDHSASSFASQQELASIFDRLDSILALSLHDLVDPTLPLSLIEELIEASPISTASQLFGYTESRVKPLTIDLHPTKGKGLVLLRTCNELLRRLSKPSQEHTVFAGRILSLLAAVFPLGERSGVNLRGDFNVENKTHIEEKTEEDGQETEDDADKDERDQIFKVDYDFYELFWKVQRFFANPPLLMAGQDSSRPSTRSATPAADARASSQAPADEDPAPDGAKGAMAELRISTRKILRLFGGVTKREKELAGAASAEEAKSGGKKSGSSSAQIASGSSTPASNKRRRDNHNGSGQTGFFVGQSIGRSSQQPPRKRARPDIVDGAKTGLPATEEAMDDDDEVTEADGVTSTDSGHFFPTYLTGRKLFEYEIRDTSFRKHVLVQYLVLFQYLLSFTPAAKESWKDWKNKTLQALFTLEDADERWIRATWREIQALMREIQPDGRLFLESVLEVLKREANWIRWKTESCPSIEKPPLSPEQIAAFASARALLLRKPEPYPHKLGTAALSELWADGLRPPVAGTRRVENEEGEYVTIATDGLEELEFLPPIPSLEHYNKSIQREKMKLDMRKKQLGIDPGTSEAQLSKEERGKLEKDERIQATIETMQSLAWRALRVASRDNLHLFGKPDRPENIEGLLKAMEEERNPKPKLVPQTKAKSADEAKAPSGSSEEQGDDVVAEPSDRDDTEKVDIPAVVPEAAQDASAEQVTKDPSSVTLAVPAVTPSPQADEEKEGVTNGVNDGAKDGENDDATAPRDTEANVKDEMEANTSGWDTNIELKGEAASSVDPPAVAPPANGAHDVEMSEATS